MNEQMNEWIDGWMDGWMDGFFLNDIFFFLGGFFISISLQPSGKTVLDFSNEQNFHFLSPVINNENSFMLKY